MTLLDNLRKDARRWLKAIRAGDAAARARLTRAYPKAAADPSLRDVQHALACERGYQSWKAMRQALNNPSQDPALSDLLLAAGEGRADDVARIADARPDLINVRGTLPRNTGARTALHFGVHHEAVVRTLLERGADPNIRDEGDDAYPLHFVAERGELPIVKLLIEHGADPLGAGTDHLLDAVGWAVCFEYAMHTDVARYLLAHGAKYTLWTAVALGEADVIRERVRAGENLDQRMDRTNHRRTPLHLSVIKRQPASVETLLDLGADSNVEDAAGLTPLDQAVLIGEQGMADLLLANGARMTLGAAAGLGRKEAFDDLVRSIPDLLNDNRRWARLLVQASSRGSARVVKNILRIAERHRAGLSIVNMEDDVDTAVDGAKGYTALHAAAFNGNSEVAALLLDRGADPRAREDKYCATPAGWARYAGHAETANLILEADVDIFEAIDFDRGDRVAQILDQDPGALDRPFKAYASFPPREGQWWQEPDCTPLEWARRQQKQQALGVLTERGAARRTPADLKRVERIVFFLQSACWDHQTHGKADHRMYDRAAQRLLEEDPSIARDSLYTATVCGDLDEVTRIITVNPAAARERGGGRRWTPILYLTYTRFTYPATIANALAIARLLLDNGADPNDFYMAGDARYTALAGAAGEGEQNSPRQPYAAGLFDLLLERGAEPFDIQVLYNTHFSGDMLWWLELVYKHTIGTPSGAAWADPHWMMFDMGGYGTGARFVLETAVKKRNRPLAEWALAHGATPNDPPARDSRFPQHTLYELAVLEGAGDFGELFVRYGAKRTQPALDARQQFLATCFALDRERAGAMLRQHPEFLQDPLAMFEAARRDRPDVLALLLDLGFALEIQDRTGMRTLHEAAANNAIAAARFLIERGAEIDPRENTWGGAPIGWASHGDHQETIDLLSRYSRNIWTLCFRGYVDRVREILGHDPTLARQAGEEGITPLWWLPDDEEKAMEIVEMLIAAGADPAARNKSGRTAADWAERRGMMNVARRLRGQ